nr:peptidylprolyl isomerase [Pelagicoccus mobilis]
MSRAMARHILVESEELCNELKAKIEGGASFADLAKEHSKCPSGQRGGELGEFGRGQMVPEFDEVVFSAPVNEVQGPVKTQFGFHLLEVTARGDEMPKASARHILVETEAECNALLEKIQGGESFADLAAAHSKCPSGKSGGALGEFGRGQMVPEFDAVVFSAPVNEVQGPVKTQFGYHLLEVTARNC